jgi:PHD/YefM family antitoxin component YafN of YafNO toxin-antitoxin module
MIGYAKEEIMPVTQIVRNLSGILNKLKKRKLKKVAISRNNRLESVIIPIEDYELLQEAFELLEHQEIYQVVKEREKTDIAKYIPLEQVRRENESL